MDMFNLQGKTALITGAGSGLGRQFATTLASAGASVALAARRREKLDETRDLIREQGGNAICVELDVTDPLSVTSCIRAVESEIGVPDILVNNAGVAAQNLVVEMEDNEWEYVTNTNINGVFKVARAVAKAMIEAKKPGSIVNIASILGFRNAPGLSHYAASKAAVVSMTKTFSLEWVYYGIRVNAIAPGYFETDMNTGVIRSERGKDLIKRIPMKRIGELHELDGALLLLASDAGSFMTGSTITVDGGQLCNSL
jgi:NAD(P)-dependent dehydrogenase (short-subunit alcohol dehydrogenase family)